MLHQHGQLPGTNNRAPHPPPPFAPTHLQHPARPCPQRSVSEIAVPTHPPRSCNSHPHPPAAPAGPAPRCKVFDHGGVAAARGMDVGGDGIRTGVALSCRLRAVHVARLRRFVRVRVSHSPYNNCLAVTPDAAQVPTLMIAFLAASAALHSSTQEDCTPSRPARPACSRVDDGCASRAHPQAPAHSWTAGRAPAPWPALRCAGQNQPPSLSTGRTHVNTVEPSPPTHPPPSTQPTCW